MRLPKWIMARAALNEAAQGIHWRLRERPSAFPRRESRQLARVMDRVMVRMSRDAYWRTGCRSPVGFMDHSRELNDEVEGEREEGSADEDPGPVGWAEEVGHALGQGADQGILFEEKQCCGTGEEAEEEPGGDGGEAMVIGVLGVAGGGELGFSDGDLGVRVGEGCGDGKCCEQGAFEADDVIVPAKSVVLFACFIFVEAPFDDAVEAFCLGLESKGIGCVFEIECGSGDEYLGDQQINEAAAVFDLFAGDGFPVGDDLLEAFGVLICGAVLGSCVEGIGDVAELDAGDGL